MMAAAMTAMSAFAQEQVADKLVLDGYVDGSFYHSNEITVSNIGGWDIHINKESWLPYYCYIHGNLRQISRMYSLFSFNKVYFIYRDSRKLPSPGITATSSTGLNVGISWTEIEGASGYEVKMSDRAETFTVPTGMTSIEINDVEYGTGYQLSVRALHPSGSEEFHSDWSGRTDAFDPNEYVNVYSLERTIVPDVVSVNNRTKDGFTVNFNLKCSGYDEYLYKDFEVDADNNFVVTALELRSNEAEVPEAYIHYMLTPEDIANGYVNVTGLQENTEYIVDIVNDHIPVKPDARYNTVKVRTKGTPGAPILVEDEILSDVINAYGADPTQVEGQVFYLSGDKTYRFNSNAFLTKGMTIETLPEDVAQGKRAKVLMSELEGESCYQFMFDQPANTESYLEGFVFRNIDFDVPIAKNYGTAYATGNYFLNMYSNCGSVEVEKLEMSNCTFTGFIRGFVRVQGSCYKKFDEFTIDGCLFYNCGYYDNNGRGYAWIAGDGANALSNLYKNFKFTNNTIYDSPRTCLITDNGKDLPWEDDIKWNITIENNTFVNFSTRATGRYLIDLRFVPNDSYFSVKRNLLVLAADDADQRSLNMGGSDIRTVNGRGILTYDIADNYSVGCRPEHMQDDGIFTGGAFSATRNSFGMFGAPVSGNMDDLKVKALKDGDTALKATDLFTNPNPPYVSHDPAVPSPYDHAAPDNIYEALKYKYTPAIITEKNIGDPRWRN